MHVTNLFNVALELLVSHRQSVEQLLQAHCGALLSRVRQPLHHVAFVVKHQLGPHLAGLMTGHNTQIAEEREIRGNISTCSDIIHDFMCLVI